MLSGLISAEQLHHALVQNGNTHYTMAQVRRLVSLYDDDRDGYLDREGEETERVTIFEFKIAPTSHSYNSKSFQPTLVFIFLT